MKKILLCALLIAVAGSAVADMREWFNPNRAPGGWSTENQIFRVDDEGPETIINEDGTTYTLRVGILERKHTDGSLGQIHAKLYCGGKTVNKCVDLVRGMRVKIKSWQMLPSEGGHDRFLARKIKVMD